MAYEEQDDSVPAEATGGSWIDPDLIKRLHEAGIVDKDVLDRVFANAKATETSDPEVQKNAIAQSIADASQKDPQVKEVVSKASDLSGITAEKADSLLPYIEKQESGGNSDAVSPKGAVGLMQLMPATAKEVAGKLGIENPDLKDPETNRKLGEAYYKEQLLRFEDPQLALAAYNMGPHALDKVLQKTGASTWAEVKDNKSIPSETKNYVTKITGHFLADQGGSPTPEGVMTKLGNMLIPEAQAEDRNPTPEGVMTKLGNMLIPEAQAEDRNPTPQMEGTPSMGARQGALVGAIPNGEIPQGQEQTQTPPLPQNPVAQASLQQAQASAQAGDSTGTVDALANGQQALQTPQALENAMLLEQQGKIQEAQAVQAGAQKEANLYGTTGEGIAKTATDFAAQKNIVQQKINDSRDAFDKSVQDAQNAAIDPNHFFTGQSTFGKILMGIGLVLNAVGNKPEVAMNNLQKIIDNDISLQKANLDLKQRDVQNKGTLLQKNMDVMQSLESSTELSKAMLWSKTVATIDQIAANTKNEQAKANLNILRGLGTQQIIDHKQKFMIAQKKLQEDNALKASAMKGKDPEQQALIQQGEDNPKKRALIINDAQGNPAGIAGDPPSKKLAEQTIQAHNEFMTNLAELRKLRDDSGVGGIPTSNEDTKSVNMLVSNLRINLEKIALGNGASRAAQFMTRNVNKQLPEDFMTSTWGTRYASKLKYGVSGTDPTVTLDELEKQANLLYLTAMNTAMGANQTQAFKKSLFRLMAEQGQDDNFKKNK